MTAELQNITQELAATFARLRDCEASLISIIANLRASPTAQPLPQQGAVAAFSRVPIVGRVPSQDIDLVAAGYNSRASFEVA